MSGSFISLAAAKELTARFKENLPDMLTTDYQDSLPYSETFDTDKIQAVLNQTGCVQFRAYIGMKEDKSVCMIFVGVNANGEDIVGLLNEADEPSDVIVEYGMQCPPNCQSNPL
jgi:hypothetical protein